MRGDFNSIPIVDISALANGADPSGRAETVAGLKTALEQIGFAYLSGHGISEDMIARLRELSAAFHALPLEAKMRIVMNEAHRGYMPLATSTIVTSTVAKVTRPNQSESLMVMHELPADDPDLIAGKPMQGPNQWPDEIPELKAVALEYMAQMTTLGRQLAGGLAEALGLPRDWFLPHLEKPTLFLRLLHYPQQSDESNLFGSAPHTDYGFVTILVQDDVGGLEVRNRHGDWIAAPPIAGTYVLNVGDILARWSGGIFTSTPHRVRNLSPRDRYSMPFFFDPSMDSLIECPPEVLARPGAEPHAPVRYGDYLMERLNRNYAYRQTGS